MWASRLLADRTIQTTLRRLMSDPSALGSRDIYIQPGRIWLYAHPTSQATGEQIGQWFDDLLALAEAAERVE